MKSFGDLYSTTQMNVGARMWDDRLPFLPGVLLIIPITFVILHMTWVLYWGPGFGPQPILLGWIFATVAVTFLSRTYICNQNQSQDQVIAQACRELASTSHGAFSAEYRTMFTGVCKPKYAATMRVIAVSPATARPVVVQAQVLPSVIT